MIRIDRVKADQVIGLRGIDTIIAKKSIEIWTVYDDNTLLLVVGAIRESLLGPAKIWLVLFEPRLSALKAMKLITQEGKRQFHHLLAATLPGRDARFAEFCGMRPAGVEDKWMRFEL